MFGQLPENRAAGIRPSYLMVKAGAWGEDAAQLHRFWGWKKISVDWGVPFSIEADDCFLTEDRTRGCVQVEGSSDHPEWMCEDGRMSWDLNIRKVTAFNVGFGADELFRHAEAFEMFWHAEGMKTEYSGEVFWNGRRYLVRPEDCFGYADKNILQERLGDTDRIAQGWEKHIYKRSRTIRYATEKKARDFDCWTRYARICQTLCRPFYALNKPAMLELRIVVRIPDRFEEVL